MYAKHTNKMRKQIHLILSLESPMHIIDKFAFSAQMQEIGHADNQI